MKVMENVELELYLGEDATGAQCTLSSAGSGVGSVGSADGSWSFDSKKKVGFIGGSRAQANHCLDAPMGNTQHAVFGELDSAWLVDVNVRNLEIKLPTTNSLSESRPRVRHTRSKYVLRYLPSASLRSRSTSCGSQARHTRCTRE